MEALNQLREWGSLILSLTILGLIIWILRKKVGDSAEEQKPSKDKEKHLDEPRDQLIDLLIPWLLVGFAILAVIGAVTRAYGDATTKLVDRFDSTTLLYLGVGATLLLFRQVKTLSVGTYRVEMLEKVRERQEKHENQLEDISLILPLLFPETERKHLVNLASETTQDYHGNYALRSELRRLRSIGLIRSIRGKTIGNMNDWSTFNLSDYVELTELGRHWAKRITTLETASKA